MSEILIMSNTFVPYTFLSANGATLSIAQNSALYALMGITYGGNATSNFLIPDLCGRVPIGMGLSHDNVFNYSEGGYGGGTTHTLTYNELAAHTHLATFTPTSNESSPITVQIGVNTSANANVQDPTGACLGKAVDGSNKVAKVYSSNPVTPDAYLGGVTVTGGTFSGGTVVNAAAGASQQFSIMQPYLVINYCLCVSGVFPSRG